MLVKHTQCPGFETQQRTNKTTGIVDPVEPHTAQVMEHSREQRDVLKVILEDFPGL